MYTPSVNVLARLSRMLLLGSLGGLALSLAPSLFGDTPSLPAPPAPKPPTSTHALGLNPVTSDASLPLPGVTSPVHSTAAPPPPGATSSAAQPAPASPQLSSVHPANAVADAGQASDPDDASAPETASAASNPYQVIVDKNIFRLNPPLPPPAPPAPKPADLPQYKLTGIVKIGDQTRVLFALASKDSKEPPTYLNLMAGERQGDLEVLKIDRKKGEVNIVNSGSPMLLTLASNSYVASAVPGGPAAPAAFNTRRHLPGLMPQPTPPPMPGTPGGAGAEAPAGGGAVIIGGGNSEPAGGGGVGAAGAPEGNAGNYAAQSSGSSGYGVTVSGGAPINYNYGGVNPAAEASIATPNSVPITLGNNTGMIGANPTRNWPPVEPADPTVQQAAMLAASEGIGTGNENGSSGVTVSGQNNRGSSEGPPMPPLPVPRKQP